MEWNETASRERNWSARLVNEISFCENEKEKNFKTQGHPLLCLFDCLYLDLSSAKLDGNKC